MEAIHNDKGIIRSCFMLEEINFPPHDVWAQFSVRDDSKIGKHVFQFKVRPFELL